MESESCPTCTLDELAEILFATPSQITALIDSGYLTYVDSRHTHIILPPRPALNWLRLMLRPLPERPLFLLQEIIPLSGLDRQKILKLCALYDISIYCHESLGEMMSPSSFISLLDALYGIRTPLRFDRAALIEWLRGMVKGKRLRFNLRYSKLIEAEIARIVRLSEPERTMRAVALWESYRDAKTITNCLNSYHSQVVARMTKVEKAMAMMMKQVTRVNVQSPPFPSDKLEGWPLLKRLLEISITQPDHDHPQEAGQDCQVGRDAMQPPDDDNPPASLAQPPEGDR